MKSVTDYLDNIVEIFPDKTAYQDKQDSISFIDLRSQAYKVAFSLIENGLQKKPVMIFMDKSVYCIAAFFGVAYSGNFYTPIDTTMPQERLDRIIARLAPAAVITDDEHIEMAKRIFDSCPVFLYNEMTIGEKNKEEVEMRKQEILDTDILYVMFTSGSTGEPKGVIISHKSVMNYVDWICTDFDINESSVLGNEASLYFDLSIQDVYAPIKTGCTTILIDKKKFTFPADLMKSLKEWKVNTIVWVPSALCMVANMRGLKSSSLPQLKTVMFCGEVMPNKQLNMWRKVFPDTLFVNLYGPTEACDACMFYKVEREFSDEDILPIGYHAPNTEIILIDEDMNVVQEYGREGEICIRGIALSYGYYNDFERTNEVFVQNPLVHTHREIIYKTGDIGKYNEQGEWQAVPPP